MMNKIKSSHTDLGENNVFEELHILIERQSSIMSDVPLGNLFEIIEKFDKSFQTFNASSRNKDIKIAFNEILNATVGNFLTIFKYTGFTRDPFFESFKRFAVFFTLVLKEANEQKNIRDIHRTFTENFPSFKNDISGYTEIEVIEIFNEIGNEKHTSAQTTLLNFHHQFPIEIGTEIGYHFTHLIIYGNDFTYKILQWVEGTASYKIINEMLYMRIDVVIESYGGNASKLLGPAWFITSALEAIEDVYVKLEDASKGSLKASFMVWMKSILAKEETKAVLQTAKEIAVKKMSGGAVSYLEVTKSRREEKQMELELEKLSVEINQMPSNSEAKLDRALDLQKKVLENEKLEIENANARIEMIEKLSDLAARGLLEPDMIRVSINDVLYFLQKQDSIKEIGPDISEIS